MPAVALTIAGSDASGGAGIQADLKTFQRFGVYGEAVVTLITVQNTRRVSRVEILPGELVAAQIEAVCEDIPPGAVKTGALGSAEVVEVVAEAARRFSFFLVVDPVRMGTQGGQLLSRDAEEALTEKLLPRAALVTPNIPEAEALAGMTIRAEADMIAAAERIADLGCGAVLVKGGHFHGPPTDIFYAREGVERFEGTRVATAHTHGTGCSYSAAITAGVAAGFDLRESIKRAKKFIQAAIETAPGLGGGRGPINHLAGAIEE